MGGTLSLLRNGLDQSFNIPDPTLNEKNLPDQTGKVFIVTGANTGVGYEVSRILYSVNGTVYMACRTESKAQAAISEIKAACPNSTGKLIYLHLDLGDLRTIKPSAETFMSQSDRLDWLNNNAGVMFPPRGSKTVLGHDLQLGTNVLGAFLFTKLLLPVLKSTAERESEKSTVRVSWAGSLGVDAISPTGGVQFDSSGNALDFNGAEKTYGSSKVANWWLAYEFGKRYGNRDGVLHNAYNPGNLKTELQRHAKSLKLGGTNINFMEIMLYPILFPRVMGAYTEIYSGLSRDLALPNDQGGYIVPWGRKTKWNRPDVVAEMKEGGGSEKLWDWCEQETRPYA